MPTTTIDFCLCMAAACLSVLPACESIIYVAEAPWEYAPGVHESETGVDDEDPSYQASDHDGDELGDEGGEPSTGEEGETAGGCIDQSFTWEPVRPQLVLALDASGSMTIPMQAPAGGEGTRWSVLHEVIRGVLQRHEHEVEFGVKLYPSAVASTPSALDHCAVEQGLEYGLEAHAGEAVLGAIPGPEWLPYGATPMGAGLGVAFGALALADASRPRAVLLVADGGTSTFCGEGESPADIEAQVATAKAQMSIETFVVGVDVSPTIAVSLSAIADAGGAAQGWFDPHDAAGLDAALESVVAELRSCSITLDASPGPQQVAPNVDGVQLELRDMCETANNGYAYDAASGSLELCGQSCEAYLDGGTLQVESFCEPG